MILQTTKNLLEEHTTFIFKVQNYTRLRCYELINNSSDGNFFLGVIVTDVLTPEQPPFYGGSTSENFYINGIYIVLIALFINFHLFAVL